VRFDKKSLGAGIEHGLDIFTADSAEKCVPLIRCNREETVDRVVREFLTPLEGTNDVAAGKLRTEPAMLLPRTGPAICETLEAHLITGSEREREKDGSLGSYVDGVNNHLLFSDGYSALAEMECGARGQLESVMKPVAVRRGGEACRELRGNREEAVAV
jgi:hypothetical protein